VRVNCSVQRTGTYFKGGIYCVPAVLVNGSTLCFWEVQFKMSHHIAYKNTHQMLFSSPYCTKTLILSKIPLGSLRWLPRRRRSPLHFPPLKTCLASLDLCASIDDIRHFIFSTDQALLITNSAEERDQIDNPGNCDPVASTWAYYSAYKTGRAWLITRRLRR